MFHRSEKMLSRLLPAVALGALVLTAMPSEARPGRSRRPGPPNLSLPQPARGAQLNGLYSGTSTRSGRPITVDFLVENTTDSNSGSVEALVRFPVVFDFNKDGIFNDLVTVPLPGEGFVTPLASSTSRWTPGFLESLRLPSSSPGN